LPESCPERRAAFISETVGVRVRRKLHELRKDDAPLIEDVLRRSHCCCETLVVAVRPVHLGAPQFNLRSLQSDLCLRDDHLRGLPGQSLSNLGQPGLRQFNRGLLLFNGGLHLLDRDLPLPQRLLLLLELDVPRAQARGFVGEARGFVGEARVFVGAASVFVGAASVFVGAASVFVGAASVFVGAASVFLGEACLFFMPQAGLLSHVGANLLHPDLEFCTLFSGHSRAGKLDERLGLIHGKLLYRGFTFGIVREPNSAAQAEQECEWEE
jgi:hypothetical protein